MISKRRAMASLNALLDQGKITPDQADMYQKMVDDGLTYKQLMLAELGKVTGELYCREEEAQAYVKLGLRIKLDAMSVPEILYVEDDSAAEPWHNERYSEASSKRKFDQEAGEPWHPSLRGRFKPDVSVLKWFASQDHLASTRKILKMAYGHVDF